MGVCMNGKNDGVVAYMCDEVNQYERSKLNIKAGGVGRCRKRFARSCLEPDS